MFVKTRYKIVREHWWEWFFFRIMTEFFGYEVLDALGIGSRYFRVSRDPYLGVENFVLAPFVPAVRIWIGIRAVWYALARRVWKAGFLNYREGELIPALWPLKLTLRRIKRECSKKTSASGH